MRASRTLCICFVLAAIAVAARTSADALRPSEYAYGSTIATDEDAAQYVVALGEDQYRHSFRSDLGDLCVVNGLNELVPFEIRRPALKQNTPEPLRNLPLFPLHGQDRSPSESLKLKLRAGGTSLEVEQPHEVSDGAIGAYLIDARASDRALSTLHLAWPDTAANFSIRLLVEASEDLTHWQTVTKAPIVNLHYGGQEFVRADVPVEDTKASFLRVSSSDRMPLVTLTTVSGQPRAEHVEMKRLIRSAPAAMSPGKPNQYEFDLGAALPIDRLNLRLPELNTVVDVQFFAKSADRNDWQFIIRNRLYRLKVAAGDDLTNAAINIPITSSRYWKIQVDAAGGALGSGLPVLDAGWLPDEVIFVARGPTPFRVLYGNARPAARGLQTASLVGLRQDTTLPLEPRPARLGAEKVIGGELQLKPPVLEPDWRRWVLWSVLILGVAALATMAWRLSRSVNNTHDPR